MKLSKTGIKVLTAQYRAVLKKCLLINLGIIFCATGALADDTTPLKTIILNNETKTINGDTDTNHKFGSVKIDLAHSTFPNGGKIDTSKSVDEIASDLKNIIDVSYSSPVPPGNNLVSKVELTNGATLNLQNAKVVIDTDEDGANVLSVKDSTINLTNSSLDTSTEGGVKEFNTVFDHATLNLVSSELPIDGAVSFTNGSILSISSPDYFSEEEIIAMFQNDANAKKIAEAIKDSQDSPLFIPNVELEYTKSDGTIGTINTDKMQVEQMVELKSLTIDNSTFIIGDSKNPNDRARVNSDSQIFIQNNSKVVLNNRAVMTFDNFENSDSNTAELLIDHSHVTLNDNSQLNVTNSGNAKATIKNNSQIFMNGNSQMNLDSVELSDSQIHMKENAILTMDSVVLQKAAIHGTGTNKVIIAGEDATTFEDTSLEMTDSNAIQVNKNGHFKIQAKNKAVSITGSSKDESVITMEGNTGDLKTTVEVDGGAQGVTVTGAIISANKDNILNLSGLVTLNGLLDPLTANVSDGEFVHNYYADDIAFNLNSGGTLKYTDDKYLYDSAKHESEYALNSINLNGGMLDIANGRASEIKLTKLNLSKDSNVALDADLANKTMDRFSDDTVVEGTAKLNISKLNLVSDAAEEETIINFTKKKELLDVTTYTGAKSGLKALSPIYSYKVDYDKANGDFIFTRGSGSSVSDYNPAVYAPSVVGHTVDFLQYNIANTAFNSLASKETVAKEGMASGDISKANNVWASVIDFDDNVDFDDFQTVDSEMMSVIGGVTSDVQQTALGKTTYGIYAGYMNGELEYDGNKINQEGGYLGLGTRIENGNMIAQIVINGGFIGNEDKHSFGTDKFDTYWAGIALKGGYDYKLNNGVIVQPNLYAGYTFVNNEDYTSKSGAKIKNDKLHLFEVAPGLKVSKDFENGWNTFAQVKYAFVMDNGGDIKIDNVALPNISADDYVEYGIGVNKELNDSWNMSVSANRRDGGREGWNGNISFKYNF